MIGRLTLPRFFSGMAIAAYAVLAIPASAATKKHKPAPAKPEPTPAETPADPATPEPENHGADHPRQVLKEVHQEKSADGAHTYWLAKGDVFSGKDSPELPAHALDIEAQFAYSAAADQNATLISQGNSQLGWAIHLIGGKLAITVNYDGLRATLHSDEPLADGNVILRGLLGLDGTLGISASGFTKVVHGYAPMTGGFPRQPQEGLQVAGKSTALAAQAFPKQTPFSGDISSLRLTLLPAIPPVAETQTAPRPAVKSPAKSKASKAR